MKRRKTTKNRELFERQVAELGEALNRLPANRQDILASNLNETTGEPKPELTISENQNKATTRSVKGTGLSARAPGQPREAASRRHSPDNNSKS